MLAGRPHAETEVRSVKQEGRDRHDKEGGVDDQGLAEEYLANDWNVTEQRDGEGREACHTGHR